MTQDTPNPDTAPAEAAPRQPAPSITMKITSEKLFAGALEVQIEHHGALYRLKKTSLGKLILTK
ncbi:MAG: hemin uptake protein HemP [Burkholderiales bacterium]|nr:hemin uptake protein HemP [Burkholderiales bacterium]